MVYRSPRAAGRQGLGLQVVPPLSREASELSGKGAACVFLRGGVTREDPTVLTTEPIGSSTSACRGGLESLVSRHLPDGEFGWGGISVTQQRRCPKASSVGTEISRRTQA